MIGRILDKYEILEEVGQGGMAVVYRGRDMALKREVAVKVLHPHLADSPEARVRFEREAQAVAKLRHANILEIYDYSGPDSPDSFIVTEFIDGQTLKDFIGKHPPAYPEIGVMIVHELGRALEHAHREGVLHRDIKPENVMIRRDGALKLMDFGIAQILDAQRMTVTGQLLGSPAYMSPEHVEGRQLDFRTDVFSVGIVLYQLITGETPFRGKNPHEVLKKIGDCKVLDPRQKNPLIGGRLARVVLKCLARDPNHRYQDVGALLADLEGVLAEVEIVDVSAELHRHFANPSSYELALRVRMVAALTRRGNDELAVGRTATALEHWNRVLTLDPANEEVKLALARLGKRRQLKRGAASALAVLLVGGAAAGAWQLASRGLAGSPDAATGAMTAVDAQGDRTSVTPGPGPIPTAGPDGAPAPGPDAGLVPVPNPGGPDARPVGVAVRPLPLPDAAGIVVPTPPVGAPRRFSFVPQPPNVEYRVDDGPLTAAPGGVLTIDLPPGPHAVTFSNPRCVDWTVEIAASEPAKTKPTRCTWRPARIKPVCPDATAIVVQGKPAQSGAPVEVIDLDRAGTRRVKVEFDLPTGVVTREVTVTAGGATVEAACASPSP